MLDSHPISMSLSKQKQRGAIWRQPQHHPKEHVILTTQDTGGELENWKEKSIQPLSPRRRGIRV